MRKIDNDRTTSEEGWYGGPSQGVPDGGSTAANVDRESLDLAQINRPGKGIALSVRSHSRRNKSKCSSNALLSDSQNERRCPRHQSMPPKQSAVSPSSASSSTGSPYPSSSTRRPKSSRQQFSACGACRMRRYPSQHGRVVCHHSQFNFF